jgi:epoxyqueuosine reductase
MSARYFTAQSLEDEDISRLALQCGLDFFSAQGIPDLGQDLLRLKSWQERGNAASMKYMQYPTGVYGDLRALLPEAKSVMSFAIAYSRQKTEVLPPKSGRVARYAWEEDYHHVLPARIRSFVELVEERLGRTIRYRVIVDAAPLLERAVAASGGLGFVGKNTLLIRKKFGSFFFLAELLWDLELNSNEKFPKNVKELGSCGTCQRCQNACPTGALRAFELDANRCISYLTIEKRGPFTDWERQALGEWIFGCDICQEVCPFNVVAIRNAKQGIPYSFGPFLGLEEIFRIRSHGEFLEKFQGSPICRARKSGLLRNALAVAANTGALSLIPNIWTLLEQESSPLVIAESPHALLRLSALIGKNELDAMFRRLEKHRLYSYDFFRQELNAAFAGLSTASILQIH